MLKHKWTVDQSVRASYSIVGSDTRRVCLWCHRVADDPDAVDDSLEGRFCPGGDVYGEQLTIGLRRERDAAVKRAEEAEREAQYQEWITELDGPKPAELKRDLEQARAALDGVGRLLDDAGSCGETGCTTVATCDLRRVLAAAGSTARLDDDREEERAKCSRCNGSGRVMVPCQDEREGCMVAHFGPCPACAADEEKPVTLGTCRGCGKPLLVENLTTADGCPCNSARGVNHGIVLSIVCTCVECDPEQTGASRWPRPADEEKPKRWGVWARAPRSADSSWHRVVTAGAGPEASMRRLASAWNAIAGGLYVYEPRELPADAEAGKETT